MIGTVPSSLRPRGLSAGHFRRIAGHGFGDGRNSYSWSAVWFNDHLYIGCHRNMLVIVRKWVPIQVPMMFWPAPVPERFEDIDLRGQIWRYSPREDKWQRVYRSPMVRGVDGRLVPMGTGFRNMAVFQGKSDRAPCIYTIPGCGSFGLGPVLLRSADGTHFEPASEPGLGIGDPNVVSYRGVVPFKGRLYISPAGSRGGFTSTCNNPVVLCSDDPASGRWAVSNPDRFGDPTNTGIFEMGASDQYLYAGTSNIRHGCQLWKTDGEGPPPHRWTKVADRGFDRGPHNQLIISFAPFQGDMYMGTAIQHGGFDRFNHVGPASPEILRVHPDDTWELVVGEPRWTRFGFQSPASGFGPGFDNPLCGYIWRLRAHDNCLYAGTFDASALVPYYDPSQWHEAVQRLLTPAAVEQFLRTRGGFDLWRTTAGDDWAPVTRNGFGNAYNFGVRSLISTPIGLVVGTANPFTPQVAVRGPAGWRYEENPRGGTEVWLGSPDHAGGEALGGNAGGVGVEPWAREDGQLPCELLAGQIGHPLAEEEAERRMLRQALDEVVAPEALLDAHRGFGIQAEDRDREEARRHDAVRTLAITPKDLIGLSESVTEELAAYFEGCAVRNVGYWRNEDTTPRQACEQMLIELLAFVPAGTTFASVLTVGDPGLGPWLTRRLGIARVVHGAADAGRGRMVLVESDDARHPCEDGVFDLVAWIEGPGGMDRASGLAEARRVLRPGGQLLTADLIGHPGDAGDSLSLSPSPEDWASDYVAALRAAGFGEARAVEATRETWRRFFRHSREFFADKLLFGQLAVEQCRRVLAALPGGGRAVTAYILASAQKPSED